MAARILLVEDSPTILNLIATMLRQQGYRISMAKDGVEGLEKLAESGADLIITDVNMPRMDGFSLIAKVRAQDQYQEIPIIVLSTESGDHDRQEGLGRGANLYLTKPVHPQDLVSHVRELVG